jgi:hypothetical protein
LHISTFESFLEGEVRSNLRQPWSNLNLYIAARIWQREPSGLKSKK